MGVGRQIFLKLCRFERKWPKRKFPHKKIKFQIVYKNVWVGPILVDWSEAANKQYFILGLEMVCMLQFGVQLKS